MEFVSVSNRDTVVTVRNRDKSVKDIKRMKFYTIPSNEIGEAKSKTTHYFFDMRFFDEIKL